MDTNAQPAEDMSNHITPDPSDIAGTIHATSIALKQKGALVFELDTGLHIERHTPNTTRHLGHTPKEIAGIMFPALLTDKSERDWQSLLQHLEPGTDCYATAGLVFRTKQGFIFPAFCFVSCLASEPDIVTVTAVKLTLPNKDHEKQLQQDILSLQINLSSELPVEKKRNSPDVLQAKAVKACHYVMKHLHKNITLRDLERETGLGRIKLQLEFKKLLGITVWNFVNNAKMAKACTLLREYASIKETAGAVGYSNAAFIRIFNKKMGCTPGAYQRNPTHYAPALTAMLQKISYLQIY